MKHIVLVTLLLISALALPLLAAESQAMVLATQGKANLIVAGKRAPLLTGSVLKAGAQVSLESGATASLIVLPQGERFQVTGPANLTVAADGLKAASGSLQAAAGPKVALMPSGKNMGHMGGEALRAPADQADKESVFENVAFAAAPTGLRVSFDAPVNETIAVEVTDTYNNRGWVGNATGVVPVQDGVDSDVTAQPMGTAQASAKTAAKGRYAYSVEIPLGKVDSKRLRVELIPKNSRQGLITRTRLLSQAESKALEQAAADYREWATRMPNSPEPWVLLMALYDEHDQVEPALAAGQKALSLAPQDLGILTALARLELEAGHKARAEKLFQQVVRLSAALK